MKGATNTFHLNFSWKEIVFYTYLWLREDGTPYYVGKGKGNRGFKSKGHRHPCPPVERIITQNWDTEEEAFEAEKFLILYYGRVDKGTGCLRNLTEGGEKPPNRKGKSLSTEHRNKISEGNKGVSRGLGKTHSENTKRRMRHKHRVKLRICCKRGHLFIPENMRKNGRSCHICEMETQRLRRARCRKVKSS